MPKRLARGLSGSDYGNIDVTLKKYQSNQWNLAERVGFEPTLRLPVNRISSAAHSTTLPPLPAGVEKREALQLPPVPP